MKRLGYLLLTLQGVSHSKVKGESSKTSNGAASTSLGNTEVASMHNSLDGTHNGYASYDGSYFTNDLDGKVAHKPKTEKDRDKDKEKRKESSSMGKLKPLPVSSTVTASSGASSSAATTAMPPLLPLPPLTSKYATVTTPIASQLTPGSDAKISTSTAHSTSGTSLATKDSLSSRGKHRHHHPEDGQPAKKHKSSYSHSQRPHSSSHRKSSASSQSSDSSPTKSIKHSHSSSQHKSSSHAVKPSHPPHHSQPGHSSSQASSHSLHVHKKPHPSSHHASSSHKPPSHHGHGHKSSSGTPQPSKKHSSSSIKPPAMVVQSQPAAKPMTPPPPPPPPPSMDYSMLSSLNTPATLGGFPSAEIQPPLPGGQFTAPFLQSPAFPSGLMPGMVPTMMQGMVPPPPPPEPEPSSPPPPPPPPLP